MRLPLTAYNIAQKAKVILGLLLLLSTAAVATASDGLSVSTAQVIGVLVVLAALGFLLLKHEVTRLLGKIETIPAAEWFDNVTTKISPLPAEGWFDKVELEIAKLPDKTFYERVFAHFDLQAKHEKLLVKLRYRVAKHEDEIRELREDILRLKGRRPGPGPGPALPQPSQ